MGGDSLFFRCGLSYSPRSLAHGGQNNLFPKFSRYRLMDKYCDMVYYSICTKVILLSSVHKSTLRTA